MSTINLNHNPRLKILIVNNDIDNKLTDDKKITLKMKLKVTFMNTCH